MYIIYIQITFIVLVEKLMADTEDTHAASKKSLYELI